jgi:hypothetical protein
LSRGIRIGKSKRCKFVAQSVAPRGLNLANTLISLVCTRQRDVKFEPLEEMNYLEKAQIEKTKADTDQVYIDAGVLDPKECRERLASDPESEYAAIDVEDVPELPGMESFGEGQPGFPNGAAAQNNKAPEAMEWRGQ